MDASIFNNIGFYLTSVNGFLELIGYAGTLLIIVSMMMTSMIKLRIINSLGCILSLVFAISIINTPVIILNGALLIINIYQIIKHYTTNKSYEIINADIDGFTLKHFVHKYEGIISTENPSFKENLKKANYAKVVFSNDEVVSMIVGKQNGDKLDIYLDLMDINEKSIKLFKTVFNYIKNTGINEIKIAHKCPQYNKYYEKLGGKIENDIMVIR